MTDSMPTAMGCRERLLEFQTDFAADFATVRGGTEGKTFRQGQPRSSALFLRSELEFVLANKLRSLAEEDLTQKAPPAKPGSSCSSSVSYSACVRAGSKSKTRKACRGQRS